MHKWESYSLGHFTAFRCAKCTCRLTWAKESPNDCLYVFPSKYEGIAQHLFVKDDTSDLGKLKFAPDCDQILIGLVLDA